MDRMAKVRSELLSAGEKFTPSATELPRIDEIQPSSSSSLSRPRDVSIVLARDEGAADMHVASDCDGDDAQATVPQGPLPKCVGRGGVTSDGDGSGAATGLCCMVATLDTDIGGRSRSTAP